MTQAYRFAEAVERRSDIQVAVQGQAIDVLSTDSEPFATFGCDEPVRVTVRLPAAPGSVQISPKRYGISAQIGEREFDFEIPGPIHLAVTVDDGFVFYLFANPIEKHVPSPDDPNVILVREGEVSDPGETIVADGQTLYIQGGGVLMGRVRASGAKQISIAGYGILDGRSPKLGAKRTRQILLADCEGVSVTGIVMIRPSSWMLVLDTCKEVLIEGIKEIGTVLSSDGIDVVSSQDVRIRGCFLRNGDDCVVIKSLNIKEDGERVRFENVARVSVAGCTMVNYLGGSAMEIGFELRCQTVSDISFHDCDVLGVHQFGSVFGIHNSDAALAQRVSWSNIRVEHHYDKLVDFRIVKSRWGRDTSRGQIRDITLSDIDVTLQAYNAGYSCSIIGGFDAEHTVEGVRFENFRMDGRPISSADDLDLFSRRCSGITFSNSG